MQVALTGMAKNDGFMVAIIGHYVLELQSGIGKSRNWKSNIFNDHGGSNLPHSADCREQPLADIPKLGVFSYFIGERHRFFHGNIC